MRMHDNPRMSMLAWAGTAVLTVVVLHGCSPKAQDEVVATVGPTPITLGQYESHYLKTLGTREAGEKTTLEERQKFLDLLVKYQLKLSDAYSRGMDKKPDVFQEIEAYKGGLAMSFLQEREVVAPGLKNMYTRRSEEIRASQILFTLKPNASPADSAAAYKKAYDVLNLLKQGKDFGMLAVEYSQDPSAKSNMGDLYYFTSGQIVGPFEDAAFQLQPGQVSTVPVRTSFGLHIIKVTGRKPSVGEVHASHIMIRFPNQNPSPEDTAKAYNKISALLDSLNAGADFAELAKRHSEDPGSAARGGDLGYFGRRRWIQPFDEAALAMKPGQLSGIVRTPFGYHLIKCYDIRPLKSFDDMKQDLQSTYQQVRYKDDYAKYLAGVKKEVGYAFDDSVFAVLIASLDTTKSVRDSTWKAGVTPATGKLVLMSVRGKALSVDSVLAILGTRTEFSNTSLRPKALQTQLDKIAEELTFGAKADLLVKQDPEFASLIEEYRQGILLYQEEQENVWNKVAINDSVLTAFFEAHRDQFTWPDRVALTVVRASNDSLAQAIHRMLLSAKTIEQVAAEDSVRMAMPATRALKFGRGSSTLDKAARQDLALLAAEIKKNLPERITLTSHPDTNVARVKNLKLAQARLEAAKTYLTKALKAEPSHISLVTAPLPRGAKDSISAARANTVDAYLGGRSALVFGKVESLLLPTTTDERTRNADSLSVGGISEPFRYSAVPTIVRLDGREKARQKTFEEASGEVSGAYQEAESKQLENDWLARLRRTFPVVENGKALQDAFAPLQK